MVSGKKSWLDLWLRIRVGMKVRLAVFKVVVLTLEVGLWNSLVMKKSTVEELIPVVMLGNTLLCNLRENVPRQESLYFCLCFFGICYRWHGSDQGWRSRNTPHR